MHTLVNRLINFTETALTYWKKNRYIRSEREKKMHPVQDWLGAFLWAAAVVLILNQFVLQAYVIPSRSMENTLLVGDRLFVNKFIYGPEILPGLGKINGAVKPKTGDVIIFESPEYRSKGALFDISQRLIYMLTLSLVDIDKDENGNPAQHFLIKRAVSSNGDLIKFINGELYIKSYGESEYIHEKEYMKITGNYYNYSRELGRTDYIDFENKRRSNLYYNSLGFGKEVQNLELISDIKANNYVNNKYLSQISPSNLEYYMGYNIENTGSYIPKGWILPLGDNRDRSHDGRYFGSVKESEVLGQGSLKFWPLSRLGKVR